ncbi:hypothetical protein PG993_003817 [Apiospora rasikravindrae]|uniref:Uncharacterized protein n=1 Tax=Apiospora rasikravindrae TaxID=990691 RepID=A0ABR1U154_9PEZI
MIAEEARTKAEQHSRLEGQADRSQAVLEIRGPFINGIVADAGEQDEASLLGKIQSCMFNSITAIARKETRLDRRPNGVNLGDRLGEHQRDPREEHVTPTELTASREQGSKRLRRVISMARHSSR